MALKKEVLTEKAEGAFDPSALSIEEQEEVVRHYLGAHPKYYTYFPEGLIKINLYHAAQDGVNIRLRSNED